MIETPLPSPMDLHSLIPLSPKQKQNIKTSREQAIASLHGKGERLVIFTGPCSIHDQEYSLQYAEKLQALSEKVKDKLLLIMRVFLEKPRTQFGWKGFLYDPFLDGSNAIHIGLNHSRKLLCHIASLAVPVVTEFLDPLLFSYYSDLITWGIIGARTTASQIHRQMASHLPFPIGFKNEISGRIENAIFGALAANHSQMFIGIDSYGRACSFQTEGNPHTHLILRGSTKSPNYDPLSIDQTIHRQRLLGLHSRLLVDCAHGNSGKEVRKQKSVFLSVLEQCQKGNSLIMGMIIESHLKGGKQLSLTDPCLNWEETEALILHAYTTWKGQEIALPMQ